MNGESKMKKSIYKPRFHFTPPSNFIGDPCAPIFYKNEFHLFYQHATHKPYWDDPIVWGHASTSDLVSWKDWPLAIENSEIYDCRSIFTGCGIILEGLEVEVEDESGCLVKKRVPTAFYTGATTLPIHWSIAYPEGAETQNIAYSLDGLKTWIKYKGNPVIPKPPKQYDVVSFRDPFVFQDPELSRMAELTLAIPGPFFFMLIGTGLRGLGGAIFMYYSTDMVNWTVFEDLFFMKNASDTSTLIPDGLESFSFGYNFEMPKLILMKNSSCSDGPLYALMFGTEGNAPHLCGNHVSVTLVGRVKLHNKSLTFEPIHMGYLDHALMYASATLELETDFGRRDLLFGCTVDDWERVHMEREQFSGVINAPRLLDLVWKTCAEDDVKRPYVTYDIIPEWIEDVAFRRFGTRYRSEKRLPRINDDDGVVIFGQPKHRADRLHVSYFPFSFQFTRLPISSDNNFCIHGDLEIPVSLKQGAFAVLIQHSDSEETCISFCIRTRRLTVHRSKSSQIQDVTLKDHSAFLPKFKENISNEQGLERIPLKMIVDQSLVEVIAMNGIVSLSSKVYPKCWSENSGRPEIYLLCSNEKVSFTRVNMWWALPDISQ